MSIVASCGCTLESSEELQSVVMAGYDCDAYSGYHRCTSHGVYCTKCAERLRKDPCHLPTKADELRFFADDLLPDGRTYSQYEEDEGYI